jgi:tellurite resistance-related uncharacterized protein
MADWSRRIFVRKQSSIWIADHVPQMVGERHTDWAFSLGYIRELYAMARAG